MFFPEQNNLSNACLCPLIIFLFQMFQSRKNKEERHDPIKHGNETILDKLKL